MPETSPKTSPETSTEATATHAGSARRGDAAVARELAALVPRAAVVVVAGRDTSPRDGTARLDPLEASAVARAVPSRVAEFTTGRACAHEALRRLGTPAARIGRGARGEPLWPAGVVGSLTHCDGLRAAAVARAHEVPGVGIDAEPHLPLPPEVTNLVLTPRERRRVAPLNEAVPQIAWHRVLFSLKESTYKLWYPLRAEWLGFEDVDATVAPNGTFSVRLPRPLPAPDGDVTIVRGRWTVSGGLVLTAAALAAQAPHRPGSISRTRASASCLPGPWSQSGDRPG